MELTSRDEDSASERLGLLQILTLILSVYVLVALLIQSTVKFSSDTVNILEGIDFFVSWPFSLTSSFGSIKPRRSQNS